MRHASLLFWLIVAGLPFSCAGAAKPPVIMPAPAHGLPFGVVCLDWPLGPDHRGISAGFHDPSYVFKAKIGDHDAIDLPTGVGTPILAPTFGKVVAVGPVVDKEHAAGVMVRIDAHWTYFVAHLSRVDVAKGESVRRGQTLGLSGGAVGAPGAGPWTTGPHLHFNLQDDGKSVDPVPYMCP